MKRDDNDVHDLELPPFELDCRDWLVATPADGSVPEEIGGAPVVAVLSTAVINTVDLESASAVLSVGLLDEPLDAVRLSDDSPVAELIDFDAASDSVRYVVPAPDGPLALLAEFTTPSDCGDEMRGRVRALMTSFRWAS
jgi:hypothetical protein